MSANGADPHRGILIAEIERKLEIQSLRDRNIFWLYFRQGLTTRDIAGMSHPTLSQKGVESVINRLSKDLRAKFMTTARQFPREKAVVPRYRRKK